MNLLVYQEPQILEVFKSIFPLMDLRQAVEMAKRILMKEKIDRQLAGQTSLTPLMSIGDNYRKMVSLNMTDYIGQKIDKLMLMMGKLVTEDKGQNKPFKP